jgi:hypothetical protein
MKRNLSLIGAVAALLTLAVPSAVAVPGDREVSVGSPSSPFSANKQNEPAVAMDANYELVCRDPTTTSTRRPVTRAPQRPVRSLPRRRSGITSFDGGKIWSQRTAPDSPHRLGPKAC